MKNDPAFKKYLWTAIKFALAVGIIAFLLRDPGEIVDSLRTFDCRYLAPAMFFYSLTRR